MSLIFWRYSPLFFYLPEDKKTMDYIAKKLSSLGFTLEKRDIVIPLNGGLQSGVLLTQ